MERFGTHFRDADLARIELGREKLAFDRGRSDAERAEREGKREVRRKEPKKMLELELVSTTLYKGSYQKVRKGFRSPLSAVVYKRKMHFNILYLMSFHSRRAPCWAPDQVCE